MGEKGKIKIEIFSKKDRGSTRSELIITLTGLDLSVFPLLGEVPGVPGLTREEEGMRLEFFAPDTDPNTIERCIITFENKITVRNLLEQMMRIKGVPEILAQVLARVS